MGNLLRETIEELNKHNKTLDDVLWIGSNEFNILVDKEEFKKRANQYYDDGYGSAQIATDLVVVGKDWWLERHEYDGSEWWEFKQLPKQPTIVYTDVQLISSGVGYQNLSDLNPRRTAREVHKYGICDKCNGTFEFCEEHNDNICCLSPTQIEAMIEEIK